MCKCNSETVDHLFLHCSIAMELWDMVLVYLEFLGLCQCLLLSFLLTGKVDLVAIAMDIYGSLFLIV